MPSDETLENSTTVTDILSAAKPHIIDEISVAPKAVIWHTGDIPNILHIVKDGWVMRYNLLMDGRRQIYSFSTAGDFISASLVSAPVVSFSLQAIDRVSLYVIDRRKFCDDLLRNADLFAAYHRVLMTRNLFYDERLLEIGRYSATERIASFLLRLYLRQAKSSPQAAQACELPITRVMVSDALGLTAVHVTRVLKSLEQSGWIVWKRGLLTINQPDQFRKLLPRLGAQASPARGYLESMLSH